MAVMTVEADIITCPIRLAPILMIMFVENFKTDVTVIISNIMSHWPIISISDQFIDTYNITNWDQRKNVKIAGNIKTQPQHYILLFFITKYIPYKFSHHFFSFQNLWNTTFTEGQFRKTIDHVWSILFYHSNIFHSGLRWHITWHMAWSALHGYNDLCSHSFYT